MVNFSLLPKDNNSGEESAPKEKKIEFAQKLPDSEIDGRQSEKGGSLDYFKTLSQRKSGDSLPVKMHPEPKEAEKTDDVSESKTQQQSGNWFSRFFTFDSSNKMSGSNSLRSLEVNLVKGEIVKYFDWQTGVLYLVLSIFAALTVVSAAYWGISLWGSSKLNGASGNYMQAYLKVNKEIKALEPQVKEILAFKQKLDRVDFLLQRHVYWTNFFTFLEDNTLSNVYFSDFSGGTSGQYTLSATTNNLDTVDAQIKKLISNPNILKAEVDSTAISGSGGNATVNFTLTFIVDPKIFLK